MSTSHAEYEMEMQRDLEFRAYLESVLDMHLTADQKLLLDIIRRDKQEAARQEVSDEQL